MRYVSQSRCHPARVTNRTARIVARAKSNQGLGLLNASSLLPQGPLVKGVKTGWRLAFQTMMTELAPQDGKGGYQRPSYSFGSKISDPQFPLVPNRYHLYVGNACPWCHRVMLAVAILNLSSHISFTWLLDDAERASRGGWVFSQRTGLDPVFGARDLREVYDKCATGFSGRCTSPLLVDKQSKRAVCNDSGLLLDNLYNMAKELPNAGGIVLKPPQLAAEIDELNTFIYNSVNNAVYRWACHDVPWSGFATEQAGYNDAQADLENGLAEVEARLSKSRFLMGDTFTDADLRLFPTVVRYDAVYNSLFRCTRRRIASDFPQLHAWMQDVWLLPCSGVLQVRDTYDVDAARNSYYGQLFPLNPSGIIPAGPSGKDLGFGTDPARGPLTKDSVYQMNPVPEATAPAV